MMLADGPNAMMTLTNVIVTIFILIHYVLIGIFVVVIIIIFAVWSKPHLLTKAG